MSTSRSPKGSKSATVHIKLSSKTMGLLRKSHSLKVIATIKASNPQGKSSTSTQALTLHYVAPKKHTKKK